MMKIKPGTTALVTGASGGIGEQFARQLAARGVNLVLVARSEHRLRTLAEELQTNHPGIRATVLAADLSRPDAADSLADDLQATGTTIDLLINNAGIGSHDLFLDEDPANVAGEIQLNCGSLVALTARMLPAMAARGSGGVINVASTAGFQPIPTMAVYGATKAFVLSFTEALWEETRQSGVRVLALCPGPTETQFFQVAAAGKQVMARGRQSPAQVAEVGLHAFESRRGPTVICGLSNRMLSSGYRVMPRALMVRVARRNVRPT